MTADGLRLHMCIATSASLIGRNVYPTLGTMFWTIVPCRFQARCFCPEARWLRLCRLHYARARRNCVYQSLKMLCYYVAQSVFHGPLMSPFVDCRCARLPGMKCSRRGRRLATTAVPYQICDQTHALLDLCSAPLLGEKRTCALNNNRVMSEEEKGRRGGCHGARRAWGPLARPSPDGSFKRCGIDTASSSSTHLRSRTPLGGSLESIVEWGAEEAQVP